MKNLLKELKDNEIHVSLYEEDLKLKFSEKKPSKELISKIKENKINIINYLKQEISKENAGMAIPKIAASNEGYTLSSSQTRMWVLSQIDEGSVAYNIPFHVFLDENFDVSLFRKAIASVIDRHEILRTVFRVNEESEVKQWILPAEELNIELDYINLLGKENAEDLALELIGKDFFLPFDLVNGPLIRMKLIKVAEGKDLFYYNVHHIVSDGWSMEVLAKDTMEFYKAYVENREPSLPNLNIQYKDYAQWQINQLENKGYDQHQDYWMEKLSGNLPVLDLPSIKNRPAIKTNNGKVLIKYFSKADTAAIENYITSKGGTLYMFLLASLNALFYRYTGQEDIIVGSPIAGRKHVDLETQIGFYVNTLALRNSIDGNMKFDELYDQVKDSLLEAYDYQMYPFDKLIEDLKLNRDTSRNALFEVLVVLQSRGAANKKQKTSDINVDKIEEFDSAKSRFDLEFNFVETQDHLSLSLTYNPDVYEGEMMLGLIEHFELLMQNILDDSSKAIDAFNYLSNKEKEELLYTCNETLVDYSKDKNFIDFFEEQAVQKPDNIALRRNGETLTYKELNGKSNQVANLLIEKGIKEGQKVGVLFNRNFDMIIALIGVLKSGGSYVPIDPDYPIDRQCYIIENSKVDIVITEPNVTELEKVKPELIFVSICDEKILQSSDINPRVEIAPNQLAYTIYTSGSTGNPKGVMIEHFSMINLIRWVNDTFSVNEKDRLLFITSVCFDLSVYDIFGMLVTGGSIYIASKDDIPNLDKIIVEEKITFWDSVPTTFNYLIDEISSNNKEYSCNSLRLVFMSGDWIPVMLPHSAKKFFPKAEIISLGGATEGTVWSNFFPIHKVDPEWKSIPYGKPIANNFFYVLDNQLRPVPKGVVGELYIGGVGVARGYDNNSEKTNSAFVKDPFTESAGGRMYKTGDLGRWMYNGNMEFIGRKDNQVKIRGFRVELGEIDSALSKYEGIREGITGVFKDQNNQNQLCAYVVKGEGFSKEKLKSFLSAKVPKYMVPSSFITLDNLPLNSNGKIDRKQLPTPDKLSISNETEFVPPRNEMEEKLVEIWKSVLDINVIGVKDDFFDLGGHSLKQIRLANMYMNKLKIKVALQDLFVLNTIEQHAEMLSVHNWLTSTEDMSQMNSAPATTTVTF